MRSLSIDTVEDQSSALFPVGFGSLHSSTTSLIERLRMAQDFNHQPVLVDEVTALFAAVPTGVVIDATLGAGGHAAALLGHRDDLCVFGIDRDPEARAAAQQRLAPFGDRFRVAPGPFSMMRRLVEEGVQGRGPWPTCGGERLSAVVGVFADLGVSSPQLDLGSRGFSFSSDGPLDMRMNQEGGESASEYLDRVDLDELTKLLRENGEGRYARRIARAIVDARPIRTTWELANIVDGAVPKADRRRGHVASRVFQGLRIAVNDEMGELETLLGDAIEIVEPQGRIAVISYHSGEDGRVKRAMRAWGDGTCTCPPGLPCVCGSITRGTILGRRAVVAGPTELGRNPRARSARLRAFEVS